MSLNRAVAVAERDGPAAGLALVDAIDGLERFHPWHAARAVAAAHSVAATRVPPRTVPRSTATSSSTMGERALPPVAHDPADLLRRLGRGDGVPRRTAPLSTARHRLPSADSSTVDWRKSRRRCDSVPGTHRTEILRDRASRHLEDGEHVDRSAFLAGEGVEHRPVAVLHPGDADQDVDDDGAALRIGVGARHADAGGQVVEVEQHLDQPGAAEVVEAQHPPAERGHQPVGRLLGEAHPHRRRHLGAAARDLRRPGRRLVADTSLIRSWIGESMAAWK